MPESSVATKPANITYAEAAAVPTGGLNALHFLRKGKLQNGQKVLVNGASGTIGTFAVQIAKYFGAEVTGVDSTAKLDVLRSIGADHVIDYTKEDFTKNGEIYDVIFDLVGEGLLFWRCRRSLRKRGIYLLSNPLLPQMVLALWASMTSRRKVVWAFASDRREDLIFLKELIEAGRIRSVIDRRYPLEQTAKAHRYVETGQKTGNVAVTLGSSHRI